MNPFQLAQQLKHLLQQVTWPTGSQEVVFGPRGVRVFAGTPNEDQIPPAFPFCLVGIGNGSPDEDAPDLIEQTFNLIAVVSVAGDAMGEHSIIGGPASDLGRSAGRGVGEVSERARSAVQDLTGADGARIIVSDTSLDSPSLLGRGRHMTLDETTLTALCTSHLDYSEPQILKHSGGTWTWEGVHCSNRFDFLQYRLVRKAGSSPSTDPSDGTVVYTGATPSFTGVATSGNTYTAFADYNARGSSTVEGSSSPEVGSYVVA